LLNELEKVYGKSAIFIIGDWGDKGRLNYISTPNMGLKKLLSKRFMVYLIDEYKTSKLYHKTELEGTNFKKEYTIKESTFKKPIHSVLTFPSNTSGDKQTECINRDNNASRNMMKIIKQLIIYGMRPEKYSRSTEPINSLETTMTHNEKLMSYQTKNRKKSNKVLTSEQKRSFGAY